MTNQEVAVAYITNQTPELKEELVRRYRSMVWDIAKAFNTKIPLEDRVSEGLIGLLDAMRDYSPDKGFMFSTYAHHKIAGRIRRSRRNHSIVHEPGWHYDMRIKEERAVRRILADAINRGEVNYTPSADDVAKAMKISLKKYVLFKEYDLPKVNSIHVYETNASTRNSPKIDMLKGSWVNAEGYAWGSDTGESPEMALFNEIVDMRKHGASASRVARHYKIALTTAQDLLRKIDQHIALGSIS
jgi:RNA polymerase sigma factor (sigma-70 family)